MAYDALYEAHRSSVLAALAGTDDRTTLADARHHAHDTATATMCATADAVRALPDVTLESVLHLLGERP